jgi:RHS repeat-associated protein
LQVVANSTGLSASFTVQNNDTVDKTINWACTYSGAVTGCSSTSGHVIAGGGSWPVSVTYATGAAGTGTLTLTATAPDGGTGHGYYTVTAVNAAASVTPDGVALTANPNTPTSYSFTVTNTGSLRTTYTSVVVCSGTAVTGCAPSPTILTLNPGISQPVSVSFTTQGGSTTGLVELQAKVGSPVVDKGWTDVTVLPAAPPPGPVVDVASVNPGALLARRQCLTIALASASASECGDLRIVHPLPAVRTMNRWRTPTLLYNSAHAIGWVSVGANVTLAAGSRVPTTVTAALHIGGATRASGSWAGSQWSPGSVRRIALGFSGPSVGLTTGIYDYTLLVTKIFSDSTKGDSASAKLIIVDRSASYFGAGWWLAGLEQWNSGTGVWVGGDGSVRQYTLRAGSVSPNRVWGAPAVTYPDSIRESGTQFVRQQPDSVWVFFDAQGRHVQTRNRQGHVTSFLYNAASKLQTITLPPAAAALSYTFNYDGNAHVSTIVAPGVPSSRTTTLTISATTGRLTTILEPDGRSVSFGYGSDNKITSRTDRRATIVSFQYDGGGRVSLATINLAPGTITRTVQQAGSQGFPGTSVPLSQAFTRLDGPRAVNTMSFYLNRFGAPDSTIDALGQRTHIIRVDSRFLGMVTQVISVTGHAVTATYDARGRILTSSEPSTSDQTATTTYQWDPKWDHVTRITKPEGDFEDFGVDAATGNRLWQQDGRGASTRTTFQYYADNQVMNVLPPNSDYHSYGYDGLGNLQSYLSALDRQVTWTNNAIGLTVQVQTPTGTCCSHPGWPPYQIDTITYSIRNEEVSRVDSLAGERTTVGRTYDEEGNLLTLTRTFSPNPAGIGSLVDSSHYDRANRDTSRTEPDNTVERRRFDEAGNLDTVVTRRGRTISMSYDSLNRLSMRALPAVIYSLPASRISPQQFVNTLAYIDTLPADNQSFQYYPDGQVSLATNVDATVTRTFHPSGRLLGETLAIKSTDRGTSHSYTTTYTYDRNARRDSVTAPSGFSGGPIHYHYDLSWGALTSVQDIAGNTIGFAYNGWGELTGITYGGGISETLGYDVDGRLSSDVITNGPSQTFPYYPAPKFRNFAVSARNARDQIVSSTDSAQSDQVKAAYSGLGHVQTSNLRQGLISDQTGISTTYASGDTTIYDGLGNILAAASLDSIYDSQWSWTRQVASHAYSPLGRLSARFVARNSPGSSYCCDTTAYSYDAAGNNYFEATRDYTSTVRNERAAYYGPDERLLATDTRKTGWRGFEQYRYDALGRRVWIRSVTSCQPSSQAVECHAPYVRRTIWDGAQELAEIQVPVDSGTPAIEEMDTGYAVLLWNGSPFDPNPFYGRVVYGPGLAVDQPLTLTRYDYRDKATSDPLSSSLTWPRFTWQVFWNYQGLASMGTLTNGAWAYPYQLGQGQANCPSDLGNQTLQRCVQLRWTFMHSAYDLNRGDVIFPSWHGSLLDGKRDRSGLEYKRNRAYDPQTGRFTQEDPIGLAGGINLYGYAGGDPVNSEDPFGLETTPDSTKKRRYAQLHKPIANPAATPSFGPGRMAGAVGGSSLLTKIACYIGFVYCTNIGDVVPDPTGAPPIDPVPESSPWGKSEIPKVGEDGLEIETIEEGGALRILMNILRFGPLIIMPTNYSVCGKLCPVGA